MLDKAFENNLGPVAIEFADIVIELLVELFNALDAQTIAWRPAAVDKQLCM